MRVERALQLAEGLVQDAPIHLLLERAADQTVAMLARERTAVLEHQFGNLLGDRFELPHALLGLEVDHRPDVQAADRGMRIDAGLGLVSRDDLQELGDVVAQVFGRDGRILDERDGLGIPFLGHREPQRHRAELPDARLRGGIRDGQMVIAEPVRFRRSSSRVASRGASSSALAP